MMNHSYDFSPVVLVFSYFWRCFKMERLEPENVGFENANLLLIRGPLIFRWMAGLFFWRGVSHWTMQHPGDPEFWGSIIAFVLKSRIFSVFSPTSWGGLSKSYSFSHKSMVQWNIALYVIWKVTHPIVEILLRHFSHSTMMSYRRKGV